ncbi:N-6 DNA methylase [Micromonospora profundi]|uniref:restriction endonuclease subunit M n=1 Tax=Micromonospora profundi TaxID=1420889 RepID=UPI0036BB062C
MKYRMAEQENNEYLDQIFGNPQVKHGLVLFSENQRQQLPLFRKSGRVYIACPVSKKNKLAKPEEIIRQLVIADLVENQGYELDQLAVEVPIKMGSSFASKAADLVVYTDKTRTTMRIIIELKKPTRSDGLDQLRSYMNATGVYFGSWINGIVAVHQLRANPNFFEAVKKLPAAHEDVDDIKTPLTKQELKPLRDLKDEIAYLENTILANAGVSTFDEIFKLIFAKLYDEADKGDFDPLDFRTTTAPAADQYNRLNGLFHEACREWKGIFPDTDKIELSPQALVSVASEFQDKRFFGADLDVIDAAFEYLINPDQKGDKGQYFTPRAVVKMCVKMLNPRQNEKVLDPACGPGGFLIHALNWVTDHYLEPKYLSNLAGKKRDYASSKLYGVDFDARLMRVARALMLISGDGRSNIFRISSLDPREWVNRTDNAADVIADGTFDLILTNPPFAGSISAPEILGTYDLAYKGDPSRHKRSNAMTRDVLFIERCMRLLRPGGRMALVLPQGNLNNVKAEFLRTWIREHARVLGVVGLSENTFKKFTNTKTSVLLLQKWRPQDDRSEDYPVFMAVNRKPVKDSSGRYLYKVNPDHSLERDVEGAPLIDHDLDEIADGFVSFAKAEGLEFWK